MLSARHLDRVTIIVLLCAILVTTVFMNGEALGMEVITDQDTESYTGTEHFTKNDLNGTWDDEDATQIILDGASAEIIGNGAYELNGSVYITNGGYYTVSGTLTDGSLVVDAYQSSKVWIMLDDVQVSCSDDAALRIDQADKVFLTLKEGTQNSLSSGAEYSEEALEDGTGGTIYAHDDLTINGSGALVITAEYKHGIECNDSLTITGGVISISAPQDGVHVNDDVNFTGAELTIDVQDDAVHSDTEVNIDGGTIQITACYEGIEAPQINVSGGEITIWPEDDGFNAGGTEQTLPGEEVQASCITISGGTITIVNETGRDADGLDSNGSIYISGGEIRISLTGSGSNNAIDYGSESGGECVITGGEVIACGSSPMAEAFSASSTQCAILYNFSTTAAAGTTFAVEDEDGNTLISWDVPCSFSSVNVSTPLLEQGKTYRIAAGDDGGEITLENTSGSYGEAAGFASGSMKNRGGMQNGSGMRNTGDMQNGESMQNAGDMQSSESMQNGGGRKGMQGEHQPPELPEGMEEGSFPEPPEGMEEGSFPEPPEGIEEGSFPEPPEGVEEGSFPELPEGTEEGNFPEHPEGMKDGSRPAMPEDNGFGEQPENMETDQDTTDGTSGLGKETIIGLAAAAAVLAAAMVFAAHFRRNR